MAEVLANYAFLPWLRQGLASRIRQADTLGGEGGAALERAQLTVELTVRETAQGDGGNFDHTVRKDVQLIGPGDVLGVDQRAIIRTFPGNGIPNFETNLLPYIEFYEEDFPWRFTPAAPAGPNERRLRPWLTLVVLKEKREDLGQAGEFTFTTPPTGLPILKINDVTLINTVFPPETETWAWAHVQMSMELTSPSEAGAKLRENPDNGFSRMLCPRKLVKNTAYRAFLIPAFETGRLAGLGLDTSNIPAQEPSWRRGNPANNGKTQPTDYPVYFSWQFGTGADGDFETLVSILKPIEIKPEDGVMAMDIHSPGFGLEGATANPTIGFEAALKPPGFVSELFPTQTEGVENQEDVAFTERVQEILNLSVDAQTIQPPDGQNLVSEVWNPFYEASPVDDPIVVPPTYGQWHAMVARLQNDNPAWLRQLNLDPRRRGAAGVGAESVRQHQEDLMHRAWKQVDEINEANRKIREAILTREIAQAMYKKHLVSAPDDKFLLLTAAMQYATKRPDALKTIRYEINDSRIPLAAQTTGFRKITRPQGRVSRLIEKTTLQSANLQKDVLQQLNIGGLSFSQGIAAAYLPSTPLSAVDAGVAANFIEIKANDLTQAATLTARQVFSNMIEQLDPQATGAQMKAQLEDMLANRVVARSASGPMEQPTLGNLSPEGLSLVENMVTNFESATQEEGLTVLSFKRKDYEEMFGKGSNNKLKGGFVIKRNNEVTDARKLGSIVGVSQAEAFLEGLNAMSDELVKFKEPSLAPQLAVTITAAREFVQDKLSPIYTISKKVMSNILIWDHGVRVTLPQLKPVMKYPVFPEPTYQYVKKIAQDFILPNVSKLPQNSVTLMVNNQAFIESFMAGLNHEMSRELLWREFPTDMRGSYFRQFWNAEDNILEKNPERKLDIKEMHRWSGNLGNNATRPSENVVLVVRGNLFIKYPNTVVYAQKAQYQVPMDTEKNPRQQRILSDKQDETTVKFPIFSAQLEPDIFLFGFDLTIPEVRGERVYNPTVANTAGKNPGWFFCFKERPGQTKFVLDDYKNPIGGTTRPASPAVGEWDDLTWEHLVTANEQLDEYTMNFGQHHFTGPAAPAWGDNAADLAHILLQDPVIYGRHAEEMIL